jgi:hypothetical protein
MKYFVFWDVMPCSPFKVDQRFGGIYRLFLQGRRIIQAKTHHDASIKYSRLLHASMMVAGTLKMKAPDGMLKEAVLSSLETTA